MHLIYDRLTKIRKAQGWTQEEMGKLFPSRDPETGQSAPMPKQTVSRKERGQLGGFEPEQLALVLQKTGYDARYLFGQIDRLQKLDTAGVEDQVRELRLVVDRKIPRPKAHDPLGDMLADPAIREVLAMLKRLPDGFAVKVRDYCRGAEDVLQFQKGEPEPSAAGQGGPA